MSFVRLLAVAIMACAMLGCQAIKDDPIVGDHSWQPGSSQRPNPR